MKAYELIISWYVCVIALLLQFEHRASSKADYNVKLCILIFQPSTKLWKEFIGWQLLWKIIKMEMVFLINLFPGLINFLLYSFYRFLLTKDLSKLHYNSAYFSWFVWCLFPREFRYFVNAWGITQEVIL
jgi:hypothetical protein